MLKTWLMSWVAAALWMPAAPATALDRGQGKLLLTGGVNSIDGAAGGGITPWAPIGTQATRGQWGATASVSGLRTADYALRVHGVALAADDRLALSLAHQNLDLRNDLAALGLADLQLKQDILGLKLRLAGEAVLDSDTVMPQLAVGLLHKRADAGALTPTLTGVIGARTCGTELFVSATKLLLGPALLLNGTLRWTDANQNGLLGFGSGESSGQGGGQSRGRRLMPEVSLAWLPHRHWAVGAEWRAKPDNLDRSALRQGALKEDAWADVFVVWAPVQAFSLTLAAVDIGRIAPGLQPRRQRGGYLSAQIGF
ncbi:MAG: DUF3034 family protein [Rubrivivax sp.]|nr:DUF3034 family protein [Rubrivivax sp.]